MRGAFHTSARTGVALGAALGLADSMGAQRSPHGHGCTGPSFDNGVWRLTTWDPDRSGPVSPVIVAGGKFERVGTAALGFVAIWDGSIWRSVGAGVGGGVRFAAGCS